MSTEIKPHYKIGDTIPDYGVVLNFQRMKQSWRYNCWDKEREKTWVFEEYDENVILAIRLQQFMQFTYIPKGWIVTISNVDYVPHILPEDIGFLRNQQIYRLIVMEFTINGI